MRALCVFFWVCSLLAPLGSQAGTFAQFRTPLGNLDVELYDDEKPVTVRNFLRYLQPGGYTNDMIIHRWDVGFVIQGGAFFTADRHQATAGIASIKPFDAITNEYSVGRTYSNTYGTLAMARVEGSTNSATSQWFFNLKDNSFLDRVDGGFTVFGHVLRGTNLLNLFQTTNGTVSTLKLASPLNQLPVFKVPATYEDLLYVDITLLDVRVAPTSDGHAEVSWQSVSNKVNRVEFTAQFPPIWTELTRTNGTGDRLRIVDPEPGTSHRFYRVRVDD